MIFKRRYDPLLIGPLSARLREYACPLRELLQICINYDNVSQPLLMVAEDLMSRVLLKSCKDIFICIKDI